MSLRYACKKETKGAMLHSTVYAFCKSINKILVACNIFANKPDR